MTTITFNYHELEELKKFYQIELEKATQRVEDIKSVLNKISGEAEQNPSVQSKQKSETTIDQNVSNGAIEPPKPRRNTNKFIAWRKFIPKLLKIENRNLNIHDFTNAAIEKFNLTDKEKVRHTLSTTLPRMTKMGVLKASKKDGYSVKFYGLASWAGKEAENSTKKIAPEREIIKSKSQPVQSHFKGNRKSKKIVIPWKKFIPQQIKENGSLTIYDFADNAMKKYNYPDREKLIRTLSPTLSRMLKIGKLTFDRKPGQKTHLYGLPSVPAKLKGSNGKAISLK